MKNVERRLQVLERLPQFQPPPSLLEQIQTLAARQLSNEQLEVMFNMTRELEGGSAHTISETESAIVAAADAVLEIEAQRMGFRSFAEAARRGGRRR